MKLKHIKDANILGKRVLVRVDLNFDPKRSSEVHLKLQKSLPTIRHLQRKGAVIILTSHRGRPRSNHELELSLSMFQPILEAYIGAKVRFIDDISTFTSQKFNSSEIILLENLRFFHGEETNDSIFAKKLAEWGELYVNDAFSSSHRKHASTYEITKHLPSYAGLSLFEEIEMINSFIAKPKRPFLAIVGGKKTKDKIPVMNRLLQRVDHLYVGGVVANTFLAAQGVLMSPKSYDVGMISESIQILEKAKKMGIKMHLPQDLVVDGHPPKNQFISTLNRNMNAVDIGPYSQKELIALIQNAQSILWNGPLGKFEESTFDKATLAVVQALRQVEAKVLIGGGDTLSAFDMNESIQPHIHFSTGGGALLEYIAKGTLPALGPLLD